MSVIGSVTINQNSEKLRNELTFIGGGSFVGATMKQLRVV